MYCIYCIKNIINGKFYIGSTKQYNKRVKRHLYELKNNKHHNLHLQRSWNKHGENSFTSYILVDGLTKEKAKEKEESLIKKYYNDTYNISKYYQGGDLISYHPHLENIRKKQSYNSKKVWKEKSREEMKKISLKMSGKGNPMYGKTHTKEARHKISLANKNRKFTKKQLENMSRGQKNRYADPSERKKASLRNIRRYKSKEQREIMRKATKKLWKSKEYRENQAKYHLKAMKEVRMNFVYKGVEYKGWKEATEKTGLSIQTMRKRMLDSKYPDSYYISEPRVVSEKTREKKSEVMKGKKHSDETKRKIQESNLKRKEAIYTVFFPNGEKFIFKNKKPLVEYLEKEHSMKPSTIDNLLRTENEWNPKKYIHRHLKGLVITKRQKAN